MPTAYIGLGSNIGDRISYLKKALNLISKLQRQKSQKSPHFMKPNPMDEKINLGSSTSS
jgi:7,8-dihydro-6-hydroxymethylpterin-pyrophosphokinase